jgi:hypothetical protein
MGRTLPAEFAALREEEQTVVDRLNLSVTTASEINFSRF